MIASPLATRIASAQLAVLAGVVALTGCASNPSHPPAKGVYRVTWIATRSADHAPLASPTADVRVGNTATLRFGRVRPTADKPAFTSFTVHLTTTKTPGLLQLVSRVSLLEAMPNKKDKLKVTKRNIGALLPMHPGETLLAGSSNDPVHLEVRLDRE